MHARAFDLRGGLRVFVRVRIFRPVNIIFFFISLALRGWPSESRFIEDGCFICDNIVTGRAFHIKKMRAAMQTYAAALDVRGRKLLLRERISPFGDIFNFSAFY